MNRDLIINALRFIFLLILQVLILNRIQVGGYVNPLLYILFILMLPFETPGWLLLLSSFLMGLSVDIFSESGGIHAAASVLIAFIRPSVFRLLASAQDYEGGVEPNLSDMGLGWFIRYAVIMILVHHTAFFFIEAGHFSDILGTFYRLALSSLFTFFLVMISQFLFYRQQR